MVLPSGLTSSDIHDPFVVVKLMCRPTESGSGFFDVLSERADGPCAAATLAAARRRRADRIRETSGRVETTGQPSSGGARKDTCWTARTLSWSAAYAPTFMSRPGCRCAPEDRRAGAREECSSRPRG